MLANHMYQGDNADTFPMAMHGGWTPPAPPAIPCAQPWVTGWLDWTTSTQNTNTQYLLNPQYAVLASFFGQAKNIYRCPADNFATPQQRQQGWDSRCRSVSGNIYVGLGNGWADNPNCWGTSGGPNNLGIYKGAKKAGDLTIPGPAQSWVYMDEHPDSINDAGAFAPNNATNIPDAPATYHGGAAGFSFADGHSEIHKWRGRTMTKDLKGVSYVARNNFPCVTGDPDVYWYSFVTPRRTAATVVP